MIEAKIGAETEMSLLSGADCTVVTQDSVIFFFFPPECNTEIHTLAPVLSVFVRTRQLAKKKKKNIG